MILSFSWTAEALLAGRKTCTRRVWKDAHFEMWVRAWREGRHVHDAWDRIPIAGGSRVARIRLTCEPYREALGDMPEADLAAEGGLWHNLEEFAALFGGDPRLMVCVVRFELLNVN